MGSTSFNYLHLVVVITSMDLGSCDAAVRRLETAVDALREIFEWLGHVTSGKA